MNTLLNKVLLTLKKDEGLKLKPYHCTEGFLTIGYGRNLEHKGITQEEANHLLLNDIITVETQLQEYDFYTIQPDQVKEVLINMCFQLGLTGLLKFKKFIKALESKDYYLASLEMMDSRWAKQTPNRALRLSVQIRGAK